MDSNFFDAVSDQSCTSLCTRAANCAMHNTPSIVHTHPETIQHNSRNNALNCSYLISHVIKAMRTGSLDLNKIAVKSTVLKSNINLRFSFSFEM